MDAFPYSKILVSGADAFDFLQAQLSNDLRLLEDRPEILAAWCNPKGRVICIARIRRNEGGYALSLPAELAEAVLKRLTLFRFRSKVTFDRAPASPADLGIEGDTDAWLLDNLRAGRPEVWQAQSEEFTPHMLNLDLLDAISLTKGCYTGQEVVARTHYKGATKRRTLRFSSSEPLAVGDKVADGERDVGEVLNVADHALLAVVPVDRADTALVVNGCPLTREPLPYL